MNKSIEAAYDVVDRNERAGAHPLLTALGLLDLAAEMLASVDEGQPGLLDEAGASVGTASSLVTKEITRRLRS